MQTVVRAVIVESDTTGAFYVVLPAGAEVVDWAYLPGSKEGYTAGGIIRARIVYATRENV